MSDYRRNYVEGGTYFFTVVTHSRRRFLTTPIARQCLRRAIAAMREARPFELFAIVLLPDHLHAVWTLSEGDSDYSMRWHLIKGHFTKEYRAAGGSEAQRTNRQQKKTARGIWQARFWEHTCRNEADLKRCVDYVHWNPVKHGLVTRVVHYLWSSFHDFVKAGEYPSDWGGENPCPNWSFPE